MQIFVRYQLLDFHKQFIEHTVEVEQHLVIGLSWNNIKIKQYASSYEFQSTTNQNVCHCKKKNDNNNHK